MPARESGVPGGKYVFYIFISVSETGNNVFLLSSIKRYMRDAGGREKVEEGERTMLKQYHINTVIIQSFLYTYPFIK